MNKFSRLLVILLVFTSTAFAQETVMRDVVFLKSGEKIYGEIIGKTDKIITLKTDDGNRFQFQFSDIASIEKEITHQKPKVKPTKSQGNLSGMMEISGGISKASSTAISLSPSPAISLAFGSKNAFNSSAFLGIGVGYETLLAKDGSQNLTFLPVFLQIYKTLSEHKVAPFVASSLGYAFKMNESYSGGAYFKLSGGANFQLTQNRAFSIGVFGKIQKISGTIIETNNLGEFITEGNTKMYSTGLSATFIF